MSTYFSESKNRFSDPVVHASVSPQQRGMTCVDRGPNEAGSFELGFGGAQKCESVWGEGGDIPGGENGMCEERRGEARKQRGGKQISKAQE